MTRIEKIQEYKRIRDALNNNVKVTINAHIEQSMTLEPTEIVESCILKDNEIIIETSISKYEVTENDIIFVHTNMPIYGDKIEKMVNNNEHIKSYNKGK